MDRYEIYRKRVLQFRKSADLLQKKENRLSIARLISFLAGIILFFSLLSFNISVAFAGLIVSWVAFAWLVKFHQQTETRKRYFRFLETINEKELQSIDGHFASFADGNEYASHEHPNASDLDLYGHASLFQFINRTVSKPAADMLASWLGTPASCDEISRRQLAVTDLESRLEWRQDLIATGYEGTDTDRDPNMLVTWTNEPDIFKRPGMVKSVIYVLGIFGLSAVAVTISAGLPAAFLLPAFALNFLFYFSQAKRIGALQSRVGRYTAMLETYSSTIRLIEKEQFSSKLLKDLHGKFSENKTASEIILGLSKLVSRLDVRLNIMVSIPLNALFFWDIHCCLSLEKWKNDHKNDIQNWLSAMAEFEVLSSFANMAYNHPSWVMPEVVPGYFQLKAEKMGHPLIAAKRRITNDFVIEGQAKTIIVTGSNMSGKSTFLRTCGINAVLAMAGAPVCATSFKISQVEVYTSMRISDSLEDNTSSFYAELKKLASIIRQAEHNPHIFLLLDEILRGTNSNDRYTGSVALIRQLTGYGTVSIVATHDLKLADLETSLPGQIDNYHFDVKIEGEELYFDYRLNEGICNSMNASILMKKMGIRME